MAFSEIIYSKIKNYFDEDNANYDTDEERGVFTANYTVSKDDCPISSTHLVVLSHQNGFTMRFAIRGLKAVKKAMPYVGVLLTYINDSMRYGNFEMDMDDGEVAFKCSCLVPEDANLDYEYFDHIVCLGIAMLRKYAGGLVPIMLGYSNDPQAAYESCEDNE